jgi:phenylacetate-CoA ligase
MDGSDGMIEVARQESLRRGLSNVSFQVMNSEVLSLDVESYDAVVCSSVLEYVEDDERLIRDLAGALRAGGVLLISVPHSASFIGRIADAVNRVSGLWHGHDRTDHDYSRRRYRVDRLLASLRHSLLDVAETKFFELPLLGKYGIWLSRFRRLGVMLLVTAIKRTREPLPREQHLMTRRGGSRLVRGHLTRWTLWEGLPSAFKVSVGSVLKFLPVRLTLGGKFTRNTHFLHSTQYWPAEQLRSHQISQLRNICTVAYKKTEYYRRSFDRAGIHLGDLKSLVDFSKIPTIDRYTLDKHLQQMLSVPIGYPLIDYCSTGGTSGRPLRFYMNVDRSSTEYSYLVVSWERAGYRLGMPMAVLRGRVFPRNRSGLYHEYDPILRHHYYSSFHMSDENMARYLKHMATIGPCFLHIYPSVADALVRFVLRSGERTPKNIQGIIAESEIVYPEQREIAQEIFGCRYFSCYGQSEKVVLAAGCEKSDDYHVWPTYGYFELLDDDGNPVTTPGQRGEIVGTGFINTVMPFIRYRTGDWATYVGDRCDACGREHTVIRDIRGHRTQEVLIAADGSEISWTALNMHDNTFLNVRQFQFMQETPGHAILRVVPANGFGPKDVGRIQRNLGCKLDGQLAFTIELVDTIALSTRGKAIYVDQRIRDRPRSMETET